MRNSAAPRRDASHLPDQVGEVGELQVLVAPRFDRIGLIMDGELSELARAAAAC